MLMLFNCAHTVIYFLTLRLWKSRLIISSEVGLFSLLNCKMIIVKFDLSRLAFLHCSKEVMFLVSFFWFSLLFFHFILSVVL